ncbi:hypothetical protein KEJ50_04435 [Candidatus Bathyarchaeota archaeon]|nr:hypothetical protein [Candidatus Bathyarchaeota archaeon]
MKLSIWVSPRLRKAYLQLSKSLKSIFAELILLPLPKCITSFLKELINGAPYKCFLKRIEEEKIFYSSKIFNYFYEDVLKACREIKKINPNLELACYKEDEGELSHFRSAVKFSILTFKNASKSKIDLNEWVSVLTENLRKTGEYLRRELKFIEREAEKYEKTLCISGFEGKYYFKHFKNKLPVEIRYFALPYHFTPLETLTTLLTLEKSLNFERAMQLIKFHIDYVREYVLRYIDLDEAYEKWVNAKASWINAWRKNS